MIGYATLGTNDLDKATSFYDALLAELGGKRIMELEKGVIWAAAPNTPMLGVFKPFDGKPATVGNGMMVALAAGSPEKVTAIYDKALELGAIDEGAPGPRGNSGFYGAYFRDLDGNKLCAFCIERS